MTTLHTVAQAAAPAAQQAGQAPAEWALTDEQAMAFFDAFQNDRRLLGDLEAFKGTARDIFEAASKAQPQPKEGDALLLRMLANRARTFPNYPLGYHIPEVFAALGEEPPKPNVQPKGTSAAFEQALRDPAISGEAAKVLVLEAADVLAALRADMERTGRNRDMWREQCQVQAAQLETLRQNPAPAPAPAAVPLADGFEGWWAANRIKRVLNPAGVARMVWEASARHNRKTVLGATDSTSGFYPEDEGSTPSGQATQAHAPAPEPKDERAHNAAGLADMLSDIADENSLELTDAARWALDEAAEMLRAYPSPAVKERGDA